MPAASLLVTGRLETPTGGYGYDRRVVEGLRARGWSLTVYELDAGFPFPSAAARAAAAAVLAALPSGHVAIVDGLAFGVLASEAAAHAARLNLVALVHHPLALETGLERVVAGALYECEHAALRHAARVIVTSDATARLLAGYDVPAGSLRVIPPGTDPAPLSKGSGGPVVELLCVAAVIPRKGHDLLIAALAAMAHGNWRLTCVGSLDRNPSYAHRVRQAAESHGLQDRVRWLGEVGAAEIADVYAMADVFVLPTRFEGYGMAVAEAVARGLPVIATPTGAISELVPSDAGVLVPVDDVGALAAALSRVVDDDETRASLAGGARRARRILPTWDGACDAFADVLLELGA